MIPEEDKILKDFLNLNENKLLYRAYLENPNIENKKELDSRFRKHFYLVRCISYFLKIIHFESKHFDKKQRKRNEKFQLILDKQTEEDNKIIDLVPDNKTPEYLALNLEDLVENQDLYYAIQNLNNKQKLLLNLIFIEGLKDTEIAEMFNITQQAVTKMKKNVINKLKKKLK
ncbi:MAG: sigma-70 family RNA polymerase sigma factor [Lactobacillus sp.]|nr:sigma-70 family RNA polymerase sigma factor [Lactobacillus sp.]